MTDETQPKSRSFTDEELQDLVASTDSGGRNPSNRTVAILIAATAFLWSLFQLWIAQPQLWFGQYLPVLNSSQTRPIHLTFAILLAFLAYPALKSSPRDRVPILDWVLALAGRAAPSMSSSIRASWPRPRAQACRPRPRSWWARWGSCSSSRPRAARSGPR